MPLRKLYLELTSACNLDCTLCYRRTWDEGPADMSVRTLTQLIQYAGESSGLKSVVLGGIGEPTLSPLFLQALSGFPGQEIIVTTNGIALNGKVLESLGENSSLVVFSVDGLFDTFRKIRKADLKTVLGSVKALIDLRRKAAGGLPKIEFQFVLSRENAADLTGVIDLAADNGVNTVTVSHLLPQDSGGALSIMYGRYGSEATRRLYDAVRNRALRRGVIVSLPPLELKTERHCRFAEEDAAYITARGEVAPCYRFSHNGTEFVFGRKKQVYRHIFGSVRDSPLDSLWTSREYSAFRRTLVENRYPSCPDCDLLEGCNMPEDPWPIAGPAPLPAPTASGLEGSCNARKQGTPHENYRKTFCHPPGG